MRSSEAQLPRIIYFGEKLLWKGDLGLNAAKSKIGSFSGKPLRKAILIKSVSCLQLQHCSDAISEGH